MAENRTIPPGEPTEIRTAHPGAPEPRTQGAGGPDEADPGGAAVLPRGKERRRGKRRNSCPLLSESVLGQERDWPTARYFQVHFEHTHAVLDALRRDLEDQSQLIGELLRRVERRTACAACREIEDGPRTGRALPLFPDRNN